MTCDNFYMDIKTNVCIDCLEGDMSMSAEILIDDFIYALLSTHDNFDMIAKPIKEELIHRAKNEWDRDTITDEELEHFKKVLEAIL